MNLVLVPLLAASLRVSDPRTFEGRIETAPGVVLEHTLVLPGEVDPQTGPGVPVVLVRTSYDRRLLAPIAHQLARTGVAVVGQDCRGTGGSPGNFVPFVHETEDGVATLDWIRQQPWCDGRVATTGMSYLGITQHFLLPAAHDPDAMVLQFTAGDVYHDLVHFGGGQSLAIALHWALMMSKGRVPAFEHLPLRDADDASGVDVPYWNDWTDHENYDDYWRALDLREHQRTSTSAVLSIGGWYDLFLPGQVADHERFAAREGPIEQSFSRLILGPWDHGGTGAVPGRPNLGPEAYLSTREEETAFLERFLLGESNGYETRPEVRAFFLGENRWHDLEHWPPPAARPAILHLRSRGGASAERSDGLLLDRPPRADEHSDTYVYDPATPTPSFATSLWSPMTTLVDLRALGARTDVLVYASPPATEARRFAGEIRARLFVRTDVEDTDFCARLVDLGPDGSASWRGEGFLRARYREGFEEAVLLRPGEVTPVELSLGPMAFVLPEGHQLALQVCSANFPRFARHGNGAGSPGRAMELRTATVELLHDAEHLSVLELPELPRELPEAGPRRGEN